MFFYVFRIYYYNIVFFFFSSRRRHTRSLRDWSSDVCSSDLRAGGADDEPRQLLLSPGGEEGGAFHGAHPAADAHGLKIAGYCFGHGGVGRKRRQVARIEAVGIAGFHEELLCPLRIVRRGLDAEGEVKARRHEGARELAEAEHLRLVDGLPIDGEARREPHALI